MSANPRALVNKLNPSCRQALEAAAGFCLSRSNFHIEIEHWLVKLLETAGNDLASICKHYDIDGQRVLRELSRSIDQFKTGNGRAPDLSLEILDLMREAWSIGSLEFNAVRLRSGYLLAALLADRSLSLRAQGASAELSKIPAEQLLKDISAIIASSTENGGEPPSAAIADGPGQPAAANSNTPALDRYTVNLTERARKHEIDPVIGRDFEIRQVIDILTRRRQNNPILTGEAGVGKTAVVEGFALCIANGDVPEPLRNVELRTLDLGLLQAGAGVKGEFENRLKSVIAEVTTSPIPIILFVDEAHTLIGAGGAAGQGDAANLLKPALARGTLRTIAATTWMEYKKYFESDAALKRRFQVVKVDEPKVGSAVQMLRGLLPTLEGHHKVRILEESLEDAVKLSYRYITDRQLPDKAVSLLDTACARVALSQSSIPQPLLNARRLIELLEVEIASLDREILLGIDHAETLAEKQAKLAAAKMNLDRLGCQWEQEKQLVASIRNACQRLADLDRSKSHEPSGANFHDTEAELVGACAQAGHNGINALHEVGKTPSFGEQYSWSQEDTANHEEPLRSQLNSLRQELRQLQGESPLVFPVVDSQAIAEVVSEWTGIPVGKMVLDEIKTVLTLRERLEQRIIGQSHAIEAISQRIRTSRAGLNDPRRPMGVFMLVGPSGVGKTETALALADILYGGDRNVVVINMSEYKEEHKISRMTGSAPGYVGYGEGGVLTEAVRRRPYSIVLLDEVEKAHPAVQEIFYQVFDKGMLQDDKGTEVNFKNTIILLTSNAGSDTVMKICADAQTMPTAECLSEALRPELLKVFKPALLGRMAVVPYFPLSDEVLRQIIRLQFKKIEERMRDNHRASFSYDEGVINAIASRCKEVESGARNADQIITGSILPDISSAFLERLADGGAIERVRVGIAADGKFTYDIH